MSQFAVERPLLTDHHPSAPQRSPWGQVQSSHKIAPGIFSVSTASHGGIWLAPEHRITVRGLFGGDERFMPFTRTWEWLEEDMDCILAVLAFPESFAPDTVKRAVDGYRKAYGEGYFKDKGCKFLKTTTGQAAITRSTEAE